MVGSSGRRGELHFLPQALELALESEMSKRFLRATPTSRGEDHGDVWKGDSLAPEHLDVESRAIPDRGEEDYDEEDVAAFGRMDEDHSRWDHEDDAIDCA